MPSSPDSSPDPQAARSVDRGCQNGDGNAAEVILVNLVDSSCEILCNTCAMMMFVAAARQLAEAMEADGQVRVDATT